MVVAGQGSVTTLDISGEIKQIHNILYVPGVKTNLFSVGKLIDAGYRVLFESKTCTIYDKDKKSDIFFQGIRDPRNNLYRVLNRIGQLGDITRQSNQILAQTI